MNMLQNFVMVSLLRFTFCVDLLIHTTVCVLMMKVTWYCGDLWCLMDYCIYLNDSLSATGNIWQWFAKSNLQCRKQTSSPCKTVHLELQLQNKVTQVTHLINPSVVKNKLEGIDVRDWIYKALTFKDNLGRNTPTRGQMYKACVPFGKTGLEKCASGWRFI